MITWRHLKALITKESLQIVRDPSAILVSFVLPLILLFIFGTGVNLDNSSIRIALVIEKMTPDVQSLAQSFKDSNSFQVSIGRDRREFEKLLINNKIRGIVIIPQNFSAQTAAQNESGKIQVIADGSEPNMASFVINYTYGIVQTWLANELSQRGESSGLALIQVEPRFWYNEGLKSRNFLVPGSIAIIMTLIGTLLTALVVAREWERGTMEAMMATPISVIEIVLGKLIPYFVMGMFSMALCLVVATLYYGIPFRGSFIALFIVSSVFLIAALGQGLLISTLSRDQFMASQMAIITAFLPAFMLSGFIFEISSMPLAIRTLTHFFPVRFFVTSLKSLFLVGDVWRLLLPCMGYISLIAGFFYFIIIRNTRKRLD
jgi:ABC-2 type transport system permease protein